MDPLLVEWLNLGLRWLHVIAAIAWIGSSFYFVALDLSLKDPGGLPKGVDGETWQVHGGGFYRMQKYMVAPPELPAKLHWFMWEAYTTWLSGFALLMAHYYWNPDIYLIDPAIMELTGQQAIIISIVSLLLGYAIYDGLCRSPLGRDDRKLALVGFVLLVLASIAYTQVYSGRGAFIHVGALVGTIMVGSVLMVIIPNQRKVVAALRRGETPDPKLGQQAKQRSLHNNYVTLPVLFTMISNHYPLTFDGRWNWLILAVVFIVGFAIRHFFNEQHKGGRAPWWAWGVAAAGMAVIMLLAYPRPVEEASAAPVTFAQVEEIVLGRCSMCHAAEPVWDGIPAAPKGVLLDNAVHIRAQAEAIRMQAVWTHAMPPSNITAMEPAERAVLAAWLANGAPVE